MTNVSLKPMASDPRGRGPDVCYPIAILVKRVGPARAGAKGSIEPFTALVGPGHAEARQSEPRMSTKSVVTLENLVGRVERLEVRCSRCERRGRLRLTRLIADHGAGTGLPDLAVRLAAGCPKIQAPDLGERCWVHFPQLL